MPTEKTWLKWLERLYNLRRDKRGAHGTRVILLQSGEPQLLDQESATE
jgi:hypothetical protein